MCSEKSGEGREAMRKSYYTRRRHWRVGLCVFGAFLVAVFLVSCMAGSGALFAGSVFLPAEAAVEEPVLRQWSLDGVLASRLCETVASVSDRSLTVPTFGSESEGAALLHAAVLSGMLADGYSSYVGNAALIARAEEAYPNTAFLTLIPAADLEARMSRYFGTAVSHKSVGAFVYLDRIDAYTTAVHSHSNATVCPVSLTETKSAYRLTFTLSDGKESSETYVAVFAKSDRGETWVATYRK